MVSIHGERNAWHMVDINGSLRHVVKLSGHFARQDTEWESLPYHIEFAPNNFCNLRCRMCPHGKDIPAESMDKEDVIKVLDMLLPRAGLITPSALSEPMLSNIELMFEKCEEHDAWMNIITNGTLLTPERFESLSKRIFQVKFSFETHVKETFEYLRVGAVYEKTLENLKYLAGTCERRGIPFTVVTILIKPVIEEIEEFIDFLNNLGVKRLDILHFLEMNSPHPEDLKVIGEVPMSELLELKERIVRKTALYGMDVRFDMPPPLGGFYLRSPKPLRGIMPEIVDAIHNTLKKEYPRFCHHMAAYLKVEPSGDVYPCCRAPKRLKLGNILELDIEKIWNGGKMRSIRESFFSGKLPQPCMECSSNPLTGAPFW